MSDQQLSEQVSKRDSELGKLPATRWDRLVLVLEGNEPERAIDAPHILERAKKLNVTDMELFYLLLLRYQDEDSAILMDVLSLYAMMTTWIDWIQRVQRCFDEKKGKGDTNSTGWSSGRRSQCSRAASAAPPSPALDNELVLTFRSNSNLPTSRHSSGTGTDAFSPTSETAALTAGKWEGGGRNGRHQAHHGYRAKAARAVHTNHLHWNFDLGPDWTWDGSLDFLRDGQVLSALVEEALDHCGTLSHLQDKHRTHPEPLNPRTYEILYPSLADMDRICKDGSRTPRAKTTTASRDTDSFDPVTYLSSFGASQLSRTRRSGVPVSKALRLIEQQGRNLAAAELYVGRLNGMCEHFLGWNKAAHRNTNFFDICESDTLVRPLNEDDKRLLHRLHWLAVALYRTVANPTIIPAPPRMSFILCRDDFTGVLDTSEEDNEIGLLVATKCSCLPINTKLGVTMRNFNEIQLTHPKMQSDPVVLPCTLVEGEAYVYFLKYRVFMPIWSVLQYYIRLYDGLNWRYELNRQEREREMQVLGSSSASARKHQAHGSNLPVQGEASAAMFDLTVQSSTLRKGATKKATTVTRRVNSAARQEVGQAAYAASPERPACTAGTPATGVAFSTVRHGRGTKTSAAATAAVTAGIRLPLQLKARGEVEHSFSTLETLTVVSVPLSSSSGGAAERSPAPSSALMKVLSDASPEREERGMHQTTVFEDGAVRAVAPPVHADQSTWRLGDRPPAVTAELAKQRCDEEEMVEESNPLPLKSVAAAEREVEERESSYGAATAVITPSCTISCSPSSQVMVTRDGFYGAMVDFEEEDEGEMGTGTSAITCTESRRMLRNFTASVVQESERNGIAILSHRFRVSGGPIGKGAFGAVYKALNLDTGRIVAVKQSRVSYDDKTTDLNWREFQTWSMLPLHANVIIFYGASKEVDTHQLLLVLEYASGGSIVQLYRQFRPIPEALFYDHALGMARGLKHLHDHHVIHGDVKPENVLTRSDGSVALTDFGCSRFNINASDTDSSTLRSARKDSAAWELFGTAAYMAPEVILNEPHLKSDVWAYACTLLQLWLGKMPWSGGDRHFSAQDSIPLMFYIANEDVVPYTGEQLEGTPRWLQRIAACSFAREVDRRATMTDILGILTEHSRAYLQ